MRYQNSLGLLCMLLASLFFSIMNALIKILCNHLSIVQCVFFRSFLMSLFILLLFAFKPLQKTHKKGGYFSLLMRCFFGATSMLLFFYNVSTIPLGIASTFAQTVPLYAVFFAYFFLHEKLQIYTLLATLVGFLGILLISKFDGTLTLPNIIIGIASGATAAIALVSIRRCKEYFDERAIILSFGIVGTLLSLAVLLAGNHLSIASLAWKQISNQTWIYIIAMGFTGTLGQIFMTKAFVLAPAGLVSPLDYTKIIFSLFLGLILGDPIPSTQSLVGMGLVIFSGLLIVFPIFWQDTRKRIKK